MPELIFPTLPGLTWNIKKTPIFQTRIQRAVSGRELRALDYPYPLWQFSLAFNFLRDNPSAGYDELRTLMGFFMACQGAFVPFLYLDPTDNAVAGQALPPAVGASTQLARSLGPFGLLEPITAPNAVGDLYFNGMPQTGFTVDPQTGAVTLPGAFASPTYMVDDAGIYVVAGGSGYATGDLVTVPGSTYGPPFTMRVAVDGTGAVNLLLAPDGSPLPTSQKGAYSALPSEPVNLAGGSGSGAQVFVPWITQDQPVITADFTYYFRCRFVDDSYPFNNIMSKLWELKKLSFISIRN